MAQLHLHVLEMRRAGASLEEIARVTGIAVAALAVILRSPLAQAELARVS